ncbi:MAG TPA: hypothetical protein VN327_09085, partial [Pseudonocardiaceae bacterium]|nr:hypothetical protein [Pseudonocardiaceae bacterium]
DRIAPPAGLGGEAFGLVLTVHMAALVAVDAHARGQVPPADPVALSAYLLTRERDHWVSMFANDQRVRTAPPMMARAVFTATLTRPLPYPAGVAALARVGVPGPEQVIDDHRLCYPPREAATVCEPLYPDRLGEDFLALSIPGHTQASYEPDPWADTAAACLLSPDGEGRLPVWTSAAVTVLIETARRWPHIARGQLFPLLRERPQLAVAAGGVALARLTELSEVDLGVLEAIEALLPPGRHVDLDIAAAALTTHLTTHRLESTPDPADRARLYAVLGYRLAYAGQREEALAATVEAVAVYRRLAQTNPAAFEPDLARGLWSFAWVRVAGQTELAQALTAAEESVVLYDGLVRRLPQAFTNDLHGALTTLADVLDGLDRSDEAAEIRHRIDHRG